MSADLRCQHLEAAAIGPYAEGLRALEAAIAYPLDDDAFTIDHGADYAAFYRGLGEAHYLVAEAGHAAQRRVVGVFAGALRTAVLGDRSLPAVYLGDLKVAPAWRGTGLARRFAVQALKLTRQRRFRQWRLVYFAAMRGARGDVTRSLRGVNPGRLLRPLGRLALFFVEPERLAALDLRHPPPPVTTPGLDLSPDVSTDRLSTAGRKDLRLASTGKPWPLVHLVRGPRAWTPTLAHYLQRCGRAEWAPGALACFGVDERLTHQIKWLRESDLHPGATCTVYGFAWPGTARRVRRQTSWLHLATAEI